jgi:bacterioferritin-associated ferredoxin
LTNGSLARITDIESGFHYQPSQEQHAVIVCLCYGISDRQIEQLADNGACTVEQITKCCGAGGDCGSCKETIADIIADAVEAANHVKAA